MKKILTLIMLMGAMTAAEAQTMVLNLDSCRAMAPVSYTHLTLPTTPGV